jgi:large subunit ribosomal protein L19
MADLVKTLEANHAKPNTDLPELRPGDQVKVHVRIVEGERERVQVFPGTIISMRGGGSNVSFTVRRTASHGIGVERTFPLHSPRLDKVEVVRSSHVRRAKLYFLRERKGKKGRLREKR